MSSRDPLRTKGGSSAVTMTAATFSIFTCVASTTTPNRWRMFTSDCAEKTVWRRSPVLLSPTTRP